MDACWEMHCNPATARVGNRNGGAHWKYISEALTAHRPDGKGAAVGETRTTGDVVLFEVLDLYLRIFPKQMKASVRLWAGCRLALAHFFLSAL